MTYLELRKQRSEEIDLGLAILSAVSQGPLPAEDIAAWAGCTKQAVQKIERNALSKTKAAIR